MTGNGKPRGAYAKTAARRREILAAGIEVFSSSGFRNGSIRDIADRVGMSQAGLLHHFASKIDLLTAILEWRDHEDRERLDLQGQPKGLEAVRSLLELVEHNSRVPGLVELYCTLSAEATSADHPAHQYFIDRYRTVVGYAVESFELMRQRGELADGVEPASAGRSMIAVMDGLQVQWLLNRESLDMALELRHHVQPLLTVDL
ncbi:TetR/AcrR family transcriptional regulator [Microbacterium sp. STN6]|uniref:TetR/AcrR family transcriptional regulator n=1 Tax=Microbacterium sp. STN6 TaxID=2995588 RepID=UPI0022609153|nr:TetR/AcrR family transcriptional regulator [Microbacterium sp. STN6]MCX7522702.1 TetR/AcrR family transcriptional regulator [Microbacterium sp. STN6]